MEAQAVLACITRIATFIATTALLWLALPYIIALLGALIACLAGWVTANVVTERLFGRTAPSVTSVFAMVKERVRG